MNSAAQTKKKDWHKYHLMSRYGISTEQYAKMLEDQGGVCAICKDVSISKIGRKLCVDHDHNDGHIRGLLCHSCNTGLGKFSDDIATMMTAIKYLGEN